MMPGSTDWMARLSSVVSFCATRGTTNPVLVGERKTYGETQEGVAHKLYKSNNANKQRGQLMHYQNG